MIRCCIFDLDGTLLNTLKALTLTVNLTLEHFGYEPVDEDHVRQFVGDGYKLLMERVLRYRGDEQLEHYEESLKVYLELFAVHSMDGVHPYDGICELLEELKKRLDAAKARRDEIERQLKQAQEALLKHQAEGRTEPDFSAEDAERKSWESQKTTLERNVESAGWEEEDAVLQKQKALKEAQRKVDDAASPENAQDTLALYQLELDYEQTVLSRYEQLQKAGGKVTAKEDGVLTGVGVSAGADTPDGAAMTYACLLYTSPSPRD